MHIQPVKAVTQRLNKSTTGALLKAYNFQNKLIYMMSTKKFE